MTLTHPRPRLDAGKPRRAAGIVLSDVTDEQIIALLDAGLSRIEIANHFGVEDHIVRYRIRLMRDRKILPATQLPYRRFFVDAMPDQGRHGRFYMIPAHRRGAWNVLKAMVAGERPEPPLWALPLTGLSQLESEEPRRSREGCVMAERFFIDQDSGTGDFYLIPAEQRMSWEDYDHSHGAGLDPPQLPEGTIPLAWISHVEFENPQDVFK